MDAYERTRELLTERREDVIKLAKQLMEFEVLTYRDVEILIGPRKYPTKVCYLITRLTSGRGSLENSR
jgi:AFG3 family protein